MVSGSGNGGGVLDSDGLGKKLMLNFAIGMGCFSIAGMLITPINNSIKKGVMVDRYGKKNFKGWIIIKERLHNTEKPRTFNTGEIWWCAVGLTSKNHTGSWYVDFIFQKQKRIAVISQIENISAFRLYDKIGRMPQTDLSLIISRTINLLLK